MSKTDGHFPRRGLLAAAVPLLVACRAAHTSTGGHPTPPATPEPRELTILAASSLTDAFTEMGEDVPEQPGLDAVKLTFSFAASSQLRTQLEQGALADLFASADTVQMDQAVKAGVIQGTPQIFARNRLVVIVPQDNRAGVTTLADLAKPGLKFVTTAKEVPVGSYTRQALEKMAADPQYGAGFAQKVLANVVSEEGNVRQVVTKVQLGEADAGIVYSSDVSPKVAADVKTIDLPDPFNTLAEYAAAVAKQTKAPATAQRFLQYLRSATGQAILKKYNFLAVA